MDNTDIVEKAKILSNFLGNKSNKENEPDLKNISKIMNIMKEINFKKEEPIQKDTKESLFKENSNIKTMKSVLPYLDIEHKNNIGGFINFMEAKDVLNQYKDISLNLDKEEKMRAKKDIFLAIKPKLNEENKPLIDLLVKFIEINDIIKKFNFEKEKNSGEL